MAAGMTELEKARAVEGRLRGEEQCAHCGKWRPTTELIRWDKTGQKLCFPGLDGDCRFFRHFTSRYDRP
jgi:hypothetical protein